MRILTFNGDKYALVIGAPGNVCITYKKAKRIRLQLMAEWLNLGMTKTLTNNLRKNVSSKTYDLTSWIDKKKFMWNVPIGGDAPIAVHQDKYSHSDVEATVAQIKSLERVGADIVVRVSVPTMDATEAFKIIKQQVNVPLVADIHFDYRIALKVAEWGVDCLRINPGNIGREDRIRAAGGLCAW